VTIFRLQGDDLVFVAHHGPLGFPGASSLSNQQGLIVPVLRGTSTGRSLIERRVIRIADLQPRLRSSLKGAPSLENLTTGPF
jgi:hypothetical protein